MDVFIEQNCPTIVEEVQNAKKAGVSYHDFVIDTGYQIFGACSQKFLDDYWKKNEQEFRAALSYIWKWYANESEFKFNDNVGRMLFVFQVLASEVYDV